MFADIANVLRIREALWRHRALGSASIMVGAGFSRNADPVSTTARAMPAWSQMAEALCEPLYPHDDERRQAALREASGTSGFLRIAQEYQAAFGTSDLNDRIRSLVPDIDYQPGDLHKRLLRLPWADVFSTNWDTLLERSCVDVLERSYDIVRTPGDIPFTTRPRIVKLHGSFPGHDPFVFTEEDYRTYPKSFSPFVNLVQQSMMETIFCLIGFSGDDPNFLHWSGWVRDYLGPSAPRIYLVGLLELSVHRRRMLEARNVMPVDLSALPQSAGWPGHMKHRYAIEWFIAALELGKPYGFATWPSSPSIPPTPPLHLGKLPERRGPELKPESHPGDPNVGETERRDTLRAIISAWRHNRMLYPGWIIPPEAVRSALWRSVTEWARRFSELERLDHWERIVGLGELAWRMEHALFPAFANHEQPMRDALESIDFERRQVSGNSVPATESWSIILESSERMARALARNGRHDLDEEKFEFGVRFLDLVSEYVPSTQNAAIYERCLWDIATGNLTSLAERVDTWSPGESDNLWNLRKAGLLAEMQDYGRCSTLLDNTLQRIRRNRRRDIDDFAALSLEGWALILALAFSNRGLLERETITTEMPEPFERWRELSVLDCYAFAEWRSLQRWVEHSAPPKPSIERIQSFDLHRTSVNHHFGSGISDNLLNALRFVMLAELTGIPPEAQRHELFSAGLKAAAKNLATFAPALACQIAMRLNSTGALLNEVLSRSQVAKLDANAVSKIKTGTLRRLSHFSLLISTASGTRLGHSNSMAAALEILSRIAVRLPLNELNDLFFQAIEQYQRTEVRNRAPWLGTELGNLLGRVLTSFPISEINALLPTLFRLPLPQEGLNNIQQRLRDPISYIPEDISISYDFTNRSDEWSQIIEPLINRANSSTPDTRSAAIYRLFRLYRWRILTQAESMQFAAALWNTERRNEYGLPAHTSLLNWVLLRLPEEHPGQSTATLQRYMAELSGREDVTIYNKVSTIGEIILGFRRENKSISIEENEKDILRGVLNNWIASPSSVGDSQDMFFQQDDDEYDAITGAAAISSLISLDEQTLERLWLKAEAMDAGRDGKYLAAPLYPILSAAYPERRSELIERLRRALFSDEAEIVRQALFGCSRWLQASSEQSDALIEDLDDAVREIGFAIASRRAAVLSSALDFASWLFKRGPQRHKDLITSECSRGLTALIIEADYQRSNLAFNVPEIRAGAVALAVAMDLAGYGNHPGVEEWLTAAAHDPLPEVRNVVLQRNTNTDA